MKEHYKLRDGKYYDIVLFELLKKNYFKRKQK
jgi:hypothetical protein